jgi:hypothetical protein
MKRFILTEAQLVEYVEFKKAEKIFYDIIEQIHKNQKFLKEDVSIKGANQSVIDSFNKKKLITPRVQGMLVKFKVANEKCEII